MAIVATIRAFAPRHHEAGPELAADLEPEAGSHDEEWADVGVDAPEHEASADGATADEARRMDVATSGR